MVKLWYYTIVVELHGEYHDTTCLKYHGGIYEYAIFILIYGLYAIVGYFKECHGILSW